MLIEIWVTQCPGGQKINSEKKRRYSEVRPWFFTNANSPHSSPLEHQMFMLHFLTSLPNGSSWSPTEIVCRLFVICVECCGFDFCLKWLTDRLLSQNDDISLGNFWKQGPWTRCGHGLQCSLEAYDPNSGLGRWAGVEIEVPVTQRKS